MAERARLTIAEQPVTFSPEELFVTVSVGVAVLPTNQVGSIDDAMAPAIPGVHLAKRTGKNRVCSAAANSVEDQEQSDATARVLEQVRSGGGLSVHCQPIYRLQDEEIVGYELLARGPSGPFRNPMDLLRLAGGHKMLTTIDRRCLQTCVETADRLGDPNLFHVNVIPATLLDVPVEEMIKLLEPRSCGRRFCLEISEQQFVGNPSALREYVARLKQAGVVVAIDDVGTGRGTMDSVILLEPQLVKFDRDIVVGASQGLCGELLLGRLTELMHVLGVEVVAKGLEDRESLALVAGLGVELGQGYLWSKPVSPEKLGLGSTAAV